MGIVSKLLHIQNTNIYILGNPNIIKRTKDKLEKKKQLINHLKQEILNISIFNTPIKPLQNKQRKLQKLCDKNQHNLNKLYIPYLESQMLTQQLQYTLPLVKHKSNLVSAHNIKLDKYKIFTNKYFKSLEGNQVTAYRKHWIQISECISNTTYYIYMKTLIDKLNEFFKIVGKAQCYLEQKDINQAEYLCIEIKKAWDSFKSDCLCLKINKSNNKKKKKRKRKKNKQIFDTYSLRTKFHYLPHCVQYIILCKHSIGYLDEQSIEALYQICPEIFRRYKTQRGLLSIKYAMNHLLLLTSPQYHKTKNKNKSITGNKKTFEIRISMMKNQIGGISCSFLVQCRQEFNRMYNAS